MCLLCLVLMAWPQPAQALPLPQSELERSCWLKYTRDRTRPNAKGVTTVDFANLRHGDRVRSPFLVDFAVRGVGVAPAGKPMKNTGHHHILIDTPLPGNATDKIPFSDTHRHFGKGQTSAVFDLPPGPHTLRLLFADHEHKPYYVFSPEIRITVTGARTAEPVRIDPTRFATTCEAWYEDEVSRPRGPGEWLGLANLRDNEPVTSPFTLQFTVDGYGVCAVGQSIERTGHFVAQVLKGGRTVQTLDLANGATQSTLSLPEGQYLLRLRFIDTSTGRDLLPPHEHQLPVVAHERM
ncbi:DUF4399 domain-containing protein [Aquabacterium sp. OR-4]|uniref:DUF4399 domain-containing protein n=1 Tax=Aquabacterium sp. OR-4 TaxID=2978127 RepID=UPI0021B329C8|nr:DUF4399 domain-containing protein [Aquabacterium sp. OR-4]MDT7837153.1 DUF4399 domain-containing protein [Aquabacterium sp. OR-4]